MRRLGEHVVQNGQSARLEQASAADAEEFMTVAAHDLRNPIAVVRASAQMALRQMSRGNSELARSRLTAIVDQTDRLTEMIEGFVDAARLGSGRLNLRPERVNLRELVELAAERARWVGGMPTERPIDLDVPNDCTGHWDRSRIVRALRALIANALLYGDPAGRVRVRARRDGDRVRLLVTGGGPGPDKEEVEHLFERFYRGPSAAEAGHAGSGLGLYLARGIARVHGGDLRRVDGDIFEIELPLLPA